MHLVLQEAVGYLRPVLSRILLPLPVVAEVLKLLGLDMSSDLQVCCTPVSQSVADKTR